MEQQFDKQNVIYADFIDDTECYTILADVCGIPKENIKINIEGQVLMIKAYRTLNIKNGYHTKEISEGDNFKMFELKSDMDTSNIIANYSDGLLKITIAKRKVQKIEVEVV